MTIHDVASQLLETLGTNPCELTRRQIIPALTEAGIYTGTEQVEPFQDVYTELYWESRYDCEHANVVGGSYGVYRCEDCGAYV